jgi:hypothetical protein
MAAGDGRGRIYQDLRGSLKKRRLPGNERFVNPPPPATRRSGSAGGTGEASRRRVAAV